MSNQEYKDIANYLIAAEEERREVEKVTSTHKTDLTIDEGYVVQEEIVKRKLDEGKRIIGPKMGLTSQAKMQQMNVNEPIYGYVFDYMLLDNGGTLSLEEVIHPKVEAEIAIILGEDIEGPGISGAQVLAKTEYILPALEIIDSRYKDFKFTLPDVIADNASTSRVVFGSSLTRPKESELDLIGATLSINGEVKELGAGAAVLGHPAHSVAVLANMLAKKGEKLYKGDTILTGGITSAIPLEKGDIVSGKFDGLGEVSFIVTE